jgi:hypothetical protein
VKTAAGTGITVDQGFNIDLIADGTNVVQVMTDFNSITLQGTIAGSPIFSGTPAFTTMMITSLPTTLPGVTGTIWNNGGVLSIA